MAWKRCTAASDSDNDYLGLVYFVPSGRVKRDASARGVIALTRLPSTLEIIKGTPMDLGHVYETSDGITSSVDSSLRQTLKHWVL